MKTRSKKGQLATTAMLVFGLAFLLSAGIWLSQLELGITGFAVTQFERMGVTVESDKAGYSCYPSCTAYVNVTNSNATLAALSPYNVTLFNVVDSNGAVINFTSIEEFNGSDWVDVGAVGDGSFFAENHAFGIATYQFKVGISLNETVSAKWNFTINVAKGLFSENITLDPYIDSILLISPDNDSTIESQSFTFKFISSLDATQNCSLYVDGSVIASNSSTQNDTNTTFVVFEDLGDHYWSIGCVNSNSELGFSEERNVTFEAVPYGADAYEDDDAYQNASWITNDGVGQHHTFSPAGDVDWVKFNMSVGSKYLIESYNLTNNADTILYLYAQDGTSFIVGDDDGAVELYASAILYTPKSAGTYYAAFVDWDNEADNTSYFIRVTEKGSLVPYLVSPSSSIEALQNSTFTVETGVTCVGGVCDDVTAVLDPEDSRMNKKLLKLIEENGKARVVVKLKEDDDHESRRITRRMGSDDKKVKKDALDDLKDKISSKQDKVLSKLKLEDDKKSKNNDKFTVSASNDFALSRKYENLNAFAGEVTAAGLEALLNDSDVEDVMIDREYVKTLDVSVPLINADDVWNLQVEGVNVTGSGQVVCVIDTGIDIDHADFGGNASFPNPKIIAGYDFCGDNVVCSVASEDSIPEDVDGHGTHVAGIIASEDSTYTGVAPGAKLAVVKIMNGSGVTSTSLIMKGIDWCVDNAVTYNISIVSMSLGDNSRHSVPCDDSALSDSVDTAVNAGLLVVVASGNNYYGYSTTASGISSPACATSAFSVGATNDADAVADFGNRDSILDVMAPGVGTMASANGGSHTSKSGTSMATPHVSGIAALLGEYADLAYDESLSVDEFKRLLKFNGKTVTDSHTSLSFNRVDALDAVNAKGMIPTSYGARPFFTTSDNPYSCGTLNDGESCNYTWTVNASGDIGGVWEFFTIYEATFAYNVTPRFNVTIIGPPPAPFIALVNPVNNSELSAGTSTVWINITTNESADCEYATGDFDFTFGTGTAFTNTGGVDHSFSFGPLSAGNTYGLSYKCNASGNVGAYVYHRFSVGTADDDGDGIEDHLDTLLGDNSSVAVENIASLGIAIDGSANLSQQFAGVKDVAFVADGDVLLSFDHNFTEKDLNLSNITVKKQAGGSAIGYTLVSGLSLTSGQSKSVFVQKVLGVSQLCIRDAEVNSVSEISEFCNAEGESLIGCPGSKDSYSCAENGSFWELSGLSYSAVQEYNGTTLSIWDSTDSVNKSINQLITFYGNLTNSTGPVDGDCNIRFNTTGSYGSWDDMVFDGSLHSYNNSFGTPVNATFEVDCDGLNVTDDFEVILGNVTDPVVDFGGLVVYFDEDGSNNSLNLSDYVTDPDDDSFVWTYSGDDYVFVSLNDTIVTFTSELDWFGSELITFSAKDGDNQTDSDVVNVSVAGVNDAPRISDVENRFADGEKEIVMEFTV